jgi:polyisoprenoid-binding protein YceI
MRFGLLPAVTAAALALSALTASARAADNYTFDPAHCSATFRIEHVGISWVQGRFDTIAGTCTVDSEDASKSSFALTIQTESIDTNQPQRDKHLRSPDFFNVKQFPILTFQSTKVAKIDAGLEVTGDLTLHGVTKSVTLVLHGGKTAEFPKGTQRIGFFAGLILKRTDFGMNTMVGPVGDGVPVFVSFEAVKP